MALDPELLAVIACPKCKGPLHPAGDMKTIECPACSLKYPIRDGIPVLFMDEAVGPGSIAWKGGGSGDIKLSRAGFRVTKGPDLNMTFQLEHGTCRALGRAEGDPQKTSVFSIDVAMALDEATKRLVLRYISAQFGEEWGPVKGDDRIGGFRRTSDIFLTDSALSHLHAMIFAGRGRVGILDLVSKNGTFVNGAEVESAILKQNDIIEIGETTIVFEGGFK